jgi:excisionase family DNA binding protein
VGRGPQGERSQRFNPRPEGGWYLPVGAVAEILRVSSMTIYRLIAAGDLQAVRVGRQYRVQESVLAAYLETRNAPRG